VAASQQSDLKFLLGASIDLPSIRKAVGTITETLSSFFGGAMFDKLLGAAGKASPMSVRQWQRALDDAQAIIGSAFIPVLEIFKDAVRLAGDALANLLPSSGEVREALSVLRITFNQMGRELRSLFKEIGPDIRDLIVGGLKQMAYWLGVVAKAIGIFIKRLADTYRSLFGGKTGAARTAEGASAAPATIQGFSQFKENLQTRFFSEGKGTDPMALLHDDLIDLKNLDKDAQALVQKVDRAIEATQAWWKETFWPKFVLVSDALVTVAEFIEEVARGDPKRKEQLAGVNRVMMQSSSTVLGVDLAGAFEGIATLGKKFGY
jgi:hypothetical protein